MDINTWIHVFNYRLEDFKMINLSSVNWGLLAFIEGAIAIVLFFMIWRTTAAGRR